MQTKHNRKLNFIAATGSFLILIISVTSNVSANENVLNKKITIRSDSTLYHTLNIIGDSIGCYFSYNSELFDADKKVHIVFREMKVKNMLDSLFTGQRFCYKIIGNQLVISREQEAVFKAIFQNKAPEKILLEGKVIEKNRLKPVPFATIGISGKLNWTVCNAEGDYALNIDVPKYDDTLHISCLGYKSLHIALTDYLEDSLQRVELETDLIAIQEVMIRKVDPLNLLKRALENIPLNYPEEVFGFNGFYRETILKNGNYVSIAEAIVEGRKTPYSNKNLTDQVKIIKGRKIIDEQKHDTVLLKLQAGMYTSLLLDVVKNPADFLKSEYFPDYNYSIDDIVLSDNNYTYVLDFNRKGKSEYGYYEGKLYIDYGSAAILNAEFSLNKPGVKNAHRFLIVKKPTGMKVTVKDARYQANYTLDKDSLYRLNYISNETVFDIKKNRRIFGSEYIVKSELVITSYRENDVHRFSRNEVAKKNEIFTEEVNVYDPDFWKDYSVIPPEKSLIEAVKEFKTMSDVKMKRGKH